MTALFYSQSGLSKGDPVPDGRVLMAENDLVKESAEFYIEKTYEHIDVQSGEMIFKLKPRNYIPKSASMLSNQVGREVEFRIKTKNLKKIAHEMLMYGITALMDSTDVKMTSAMGPDSRSPFTADADRLTPDHIVRDEAIKRIFVLEATTRFSYNLLEDAYATKISKYSSTLLSRMQNDMNRGFELRYYVLAASDSMMHTNMEISQEEVNSLCIHVKIGQWLFDSWVRRGLIPPDEGERSLQKSALLTKFELGCEELNATKMEEYLPTGEEPTVPFMTEEFVQNLLNNNTVDDMEVFNELESIMKKAEKDWDQADKRNMIEDEMLLLTKKYKAMNSKAESVGIRKEMKPITIFPDFGFFPTGTHLVNQSEDDERSISDLWSFLLLKAPNDYDIHEMEMSSLEVVNENIKVMKRSANRNSLNVVQITNDSMLHYLKTQGIGVKRDKELLADLVGKKKHQGLYFDLSTDLSDIQQLLDSSDSMNEKMEDIEIDEKLMRSLFDRCNLAPNSAMNKASFEMFMEFCKTRMGRLMYYIDCVSQEVNVSLARYNHVDAKAASLTYKRVMGLDETYLCVRALGPSEKASFSVCYRFDEKSRSPFKQTTKVISNKMIYQATDFVTASRDTLNRYLSMLGRAFSIFSTCKEIFSKNDWYTHFMMIMMIELNGKQALSADLQQVRYMYMHLLSGNRRFMSPFSLLRKFDDGFRCRLHLFCFKKIVETFTLMLKARPIPQDFVLQYLAKINKLSNSGIVDELSRAPFFLDKEQLNMMLRSLNERIEIAKKSEEEIDDEENPSDNDRWINIRSWVTGEIMEKAEDTLSLSVFGYFHEKDSANSRVHSYRRIFAKIIKSEILMRKTDRDFLGTKSAEPGYDYQEHEFSRNLVMSAAKKLRSDLNVKYSGDWESRLKNLWKEKLYSESADQYATLKASANLPDSEDYTELDNVNFEEARKTKDKAQLGSGRRKAITAIVDSLKKKLISENPLADIKEIIEFVRREMDSAVLVDLFEKNQIGKSREIFVLHIAFRLLISCVETISRSISECVEEEMMTKGDLKLRANEKFLSKVRSEMKSAGIKESIPIISSCDATTWCQRFVMPQFAIMLRELVPEKWVKTICIVLNMATKKKLVLPKWLLNDMMNHPDQEIYDEAMTELRSQFLGESDQNDLIRSKFTRRILHNESNFMQGIFHYTSSLYHCMILRFLDTRFKDLMSIKETRIRLLTNIKVSSDDSSRYLVAVFKQSDMQNTARKWGEMYNLFIRRSLRNANIEESEIKTTFCSIFRLEEFNSTYDMWGKIMVPTLKMVSSLFAIDPQPRMDLMLHIMSNLLRTVAETGCSLKLLSDLQISQFYSHWCMLGLTTNIMFKKYSDLLANLPHPMFGFFPLQPGELPLFGLNFATYILLRSNDTSMMIQHEIISRGGLEYDMNLNPQTTYSLTSGSNIRYKGFLNSFKGWDMMESYEEWARDNFQQILSYTKTDERIGFNIARKIRSPGVAISFGTTSGSAQYARSVYLLQTPVVTIKKYVMNKVDGKDKRDVLISKTSLVNSMEMFLHEMKMNHSRREFKETLSLLYPQQTIYESAISEIEVMKSGVPVTHIDQRAKRILKFELKRREMRTQISLRDCLNYFWYGKRSFGSTYEYKVSMNFYRSKMSWLSEKSLDETINSSNYPYSDVIGLITLIEELEPKGTSIKMLTTVKDRGNLGLLLSGIMANQTFKGMKIELSRLHSLRKVSGESDIEFDRRRFLDGQLSLILSSARLTAYNDLSTYSYPMIQSIFDSVACKERRVMMTLYNFSADDQGITPEEIIEKYSYSTRDVNLGILKYFSKEFINRYETTKRNLQQIAKDMTPIMINSLKSLRVGITGSFEKEQNYKDDRWIGKGIFSGFVDSTFYRIELLDQAVISIRVSNLDRFRRDCLFSFKKVMSLFVKANCTGVRSQFADGRFKSVKGDSWDMISNQWVSGFKLLDGSNVQIIEDADMSKILESKDIELVLSADSNSIKLEQSISIKGIRSKLIVLEYSPNVANLVLSERAMSEFKIYQSKVTMKTLTMKEQRAIKTLSEKKPMLYIENIYTYWDNNVEVPAAPLMALIESILDRLDEKERELGDSRNLEWRRESKGLNDIEFQRLNVMKDWLIFSLKEKLRFKNVRARNLIDTSIEYRQIEINEEELGEFDFGALEESMLMEVDSSQDFDLEIDKMLSDTLTAGIEEYADRESKEKFKASVLPISSFWNNVVFSSQGVGGFDIGLLVFSSVRMKVVEGFEPLFRLFENEKRTEKMDSIKPIVAGFDAPEIDVESFKEDWSNDQYSNFPKQED